MSEQPAGAPAEPLQPPQAPEKPLPGDCCGGGCLHCVYDVYDEALERYERALAEWEARCRR
jgi:hypothetical protein